MNRRNNLLTNLALGTVLVMAAVAVAPGAAYGQLIEANIANTDCEQEQKTKQDSDQTQLNEQNTNQSSEESSEEKSEQETEQDTEQESEASQDCSAVDIL